MINDSHSLAARLAQEELPVAQALAYAAQIGNTLRQIHSQGTVHGALTPSAVLLSGSGAQLLPAAPGEVSDLTPYFAPELALGHKPDASTDIYSFGAVLYRMLTGQAVAHPLTPSGNPALDRLLDTCLAADRSHRFQRMQHVLMELRLISGAERRAEAEAILHRNHFEQMLRAHAQQLEARWASRFDMIEKSAAVEHSILQDACDGLKAVREQLSDMTSLLAAAHESIDRLSRVTDGTRTDMAEQRQASSRIRELEQNVRAQAVAIEMNANGMVRIDDLVERVVEALESLQSLVLEHSEEKVAVVKVA
jgi:serine/threonine protein kinase